MSNHTPGPWKAVYVGSSDWDLDGPTTQEDWMLAAAAPDLLEAIRKLRTMCADFGAHTACEVASAAIFKATGEQQ
jgi:hypothetical protein